MLSVGARFLCIDSFSSVRLDELTLLADQVVGVDLESEVEGLVAAKESHEWAHSLGIDPAVWLGVEVLPGLLEVGGEVVVSLLSMEGHVGSHDLLGGIQCIFLFQDEFAGWLTAPGGELGGVFSDHRVHELVVARAWPLEVVWNLSLIVSKSLIPLEFIVTGWETWMLIFWTPTSSNIWILSIHSSLQLNVFRPDLLILHIIVVLLLLSQGISDMVLL